MLSLLSNLEEGSEDDDDEDKILAFRLTYAPEKESETQVVSSMKKYNHSMVADKEDYFQASSPLSGVGSVEDSLETVKKRSVNLLMKVGFQPRIFKLRFKELIFYLKQSAEAVEGIFLMKEQLCLLVQIAEEEVDASSFACSLLLILQECFLHSPDITPVWSCLFVFYDDGGDMRSLFGISSVISRAPGNESMKHSAHAQKANSFARSKVRFKHFLECCVFTPWFTPARSSLVVKKDDGKVSSFSFLLVHVGSPDITSMMLVGHFHGYYPEVLACMMKGPLDSVEWAVFGNQGTLHVPQCRDDSALLWTRLPMVLLADNDCMRNEPSVHAEGTIWSVQDLPHVSHVTDGLSFIACLPENTMEKECCNFLSIIQRISPKFTFCKACPPDNITLRLSRQGKRISLFRLYADFKEKLCGLATDFREKEAPHTPLISRSSSSLGVEKHCSMVHVKRLQKAMSSKSSFESDVISRLTFQHENGLPLTYGPQLSSKGVFSMTFGSWPTCTSRDFQNPTVHALADVKLLEKATVFKGHAQTAAFCPSLSSKSLAWTWISMGVSSMQCYEKICKRNCTCPNQPQDFSRASISR